LSILNWKKDKKVKANGNGVSLIILMRIIGFFPAPEDYRLYYDLPK